MWVELPLALIVEGLRLRNRSAGLGPSRLGSSAEVTAALDTLEDGIGEPHDELLRAADILEKREDFHRSVAAVGRAAEGAKR